MPSTKNICNCPNPPAGKATFSAQRVANWLLSSVANRRREVLAPITESQMIFLRRGMDSEVKESPRLDRGEEREYEVLRHINYRPSGKLAGAIETWIRGVETVPDVLGDEEGGWSAAGLRSYDSSLYNYPGPEYFEHFEPGTPEEVEDLQPPYGFHFIAQQETDGNWTWFLRDTDGEPILQAYTSYATHDEVSNDIQRIFGNWWVGIFYVYVEKTT